MSVSILRGVGSYRINRRPRIIGRRRAEGTPPPPPPPGGGSINTTVAVDSLSAFAQTDLIVTFGMPILGSVENPADRPNLLYEPSMLAGDRFVAMDGATALDFQEDGRSTDLRGDIRYVMCAMKIPAMAGNETRRVVNLTLEEGLPAATTSRTPQQLLAIDPNAECVVTAVVKGVTYVATFREAAAAPTTFVFGQAHRHEGFIKDGPLVKSFICKAPFRSGGVAHPTLYQMFFATAYSTDGFVNQISWNFGPATINGWLTLTNQADQSFDATITTGIAAPIVAKRYASRTVAVQLQRVGVNLNTVPNTPGTFTINDHGKYITNSVTGTRAVVFKVSPDGGSTRLIDFPAPTLELATFPINTIVINGMTVHFGGKWHETNIWHGKKHLALVRHERQYVQDTRMIPNLAMPSSFVNNATGDFNIQGNGVNTGTNWLDKAGNYPLRFYFTTPQPTIGEQGQATNEPDARFLPLYLQYGAMHKLEVDAEGRDTGPHYDATTMRRMLETPYLYANHSPWTILDPNTGLLMNPVLRPTQTDDMIPARATPRALPYEEGLTNHTENHGYLPFLLTADPWYLWQQWEVSWRCFMVKGSGRSGNGLTRTMWIDGAVRGQIWPMRAFCQAAVCTPDGLPESVFGTTKANLRQLIDFNWTFAKKRYYNDGSGHSGWSTETPPGPDAHTLGDPTWGTTGFGGGGGVAEILGFIPSYVLVCLPHIYEMGELTADGFAFYEWYFAGLVESIRNPAIADTSVTFGIYHGPTVRVDAGVPNTWSAVYALAAALAPSGIQAYMAYEWWAFVAGIDLGLYDSAKTREAYNIILNIMTNPPKNGGHLEGDPPVMVCTSQNINHYLGHWIKARDIP